MPDELDSAISEKVDNARAAWSEWKSWRETSPDIPHEPAVFFPPEAASASNYVENEDGSITIYFFDEAGLTLIHEDENGVPDFSAATPVEVRTATAEEAAAEEAWHQYVRSEYGDYDFNYDIHNNLEAKKA